MATFDRGRQGEVTATAAARRAAAQLPAVEPSTPARAGVICLIQHVEQGLRLKRLVIIPSAALQPAASPPRRGRPAAALNEFLKLLASPT
jgi:hypothetical protein